MKLVFGDIRMIQLNYKHLLYLFTISIGLNFLKMGRIKSISFCTLFVHLALANGHGHPFLLLHPYPFIELSPLPVLEPVVVARIPTRTILPEENHYLPIENRHSTQCTTRKGQTGNCTNVEDCYGIFNLVNRNLNPARIIVPRSIDTPADEGHIYFQPDSTSVDFSDVLLDEIHETTQSSTCLPNSGKRSQICCPLNSRREESVLNRHALGVESAIQANSQIEKKLKAKFSQTCGERKVILRAKRIVVNGSTSGTPKITGGTMAARGEFPWMVAIYGTNGKQTCGGSLINNQYVLTAAHCLATYNANDVAKLKVAIGDHHLHSTVDGAHETRKVSKIFLHTGFDLKHFADDIALMKLDLPVMYNDYIQPICLPPPASTSGNPIRGEFEGKKVTVTGWGRERSHGSLSPVLRKVEIPIWKHAECQRIYRIFAPSMKVQQSHICAGDGKKNKDACVGDSGGPLVFSSGSKWYQLGIVSWGKGCGSFPGVYTRVDTYLQWIMKNID